MRLVLSEKLKVYDAIKYFEKNSDSKPSQGSRGSDQRQKLLCFASHGMIQDGRQVLNVEATKTFINIGFSTKPEVKSRSERARWNSQII